MHTKEEATTKKIGKIEKEKQIEETISTVAHTNTQWLFGVLSRLLAVQKKRRIIC